MQEVGNADVQIVGSNWDAANAKAEEYLAKNSDAFFVHPFNQATTWEGHSSIVQEIHQQLVNDFDDHRPPSAIITCVGGGGLAAGNLIVFLLICTDNCLSVFAGRQILTNTRSKM